MAESWLDSVFVKVMKRRPFFADGWGSEHGLRVVSALPSEREVLPSIAPSWGEPRRHGDLEWLEGRFPSPEAELLQLPLESREAVVRWVRPVGGDRLPICLHTAATGEFGFSRRMRLARPLASRGIASLLLENPYYGSRQPADQHGPSVRTVYDLLAMGRACVQEARGLLAWFHGQGHRLLGVSGFSMGGQTAAMAAASCPFPVAGVPLAGSHSATAVFLDGLLRYVVDWDALAPDGDRDRARARLVELMSALAVQALPPPVHAAACVVVAGSGDGFVRPDSSQALYAHWAGSELRWVRTGHVGGYLFQRRAYLQAIEDAFRRLGEVHAAPGGMETAPSGV